MKELQRYIANWYGEYMDEYKNGEWVLFADVEAREEARKLTLCELQKQFEKATGDLLGFDFSKCSYLGSYSDDDTRRAFFIYEKAARENNLLKDGE